MFINLEKKSCLVVGGGYVALRKVQVLLDFGADVIVVAPEILSQIKALEENGVRIRERAFRETDISDCELVVAATNDPDQNHVIAQLAKAQRIPVNAVDQKEDCTFIFPSYVRQRDLVGAFSSGGSSPVLTQYLKAQLEEILTPGLGQINTYMGSIRETVKEKVETEAFRKRVYQKVLAQLLKETENQFSDENLEAVIEEVLREEEDT